MYEIISIELQDLTHVFGTVLSVLSSAHDSITVRFTISEYTPFSSRKLLLTPLTPGSKERRSQWVTAKRREGAGTVFAMWKVHDLRHQEGACEINPILSIPE